MTNTFLELVSRATGAAVLVLAVSAAAAEDQFTEQRDARNGQVIFMRNEAVQTTTASLASRSAVKAPATGPIFNRADLGKPEWTNAVATARAFLHQHGRKFAAGGTLDPDADLVALRAERDGLGMTHVRFTQTYRGLPVFGAEASVHLAADGRVSSAGARVVPAVQVDIQPTFTATQAVAKAVALWQAQFHRTEIPESTSSNLCIFAPGLLKNDGNPASYLVWEVRLALECKETGRLLSAEDYYLDARTGEMREQLSEMQNLSRKIFDCSAPAPPGNPSTCPFVTVDGYRYGRLEGDPPVGLNPRYLPQEISQDTDTLYDKLNVVQQFYWNHFGRDGASNQGGTGYGGNYYPWRTYGITYLDYTPGFQCPNAAHYRGQIEFCKDLILDDVVAHEYAHAVVMWSHFDTGAGLAVGMTYYGESGALNESHSDVMGEMFELAKNGRCDWINAGGASKFPPFRVLFDPPSWTSNGAPTPHPDRFQSPFEYCGSDESGGVHHNSTIPSKAAYLLSRGGYFNGCTIPRLGETKVEQIVYRAVTQYYAQTENFNGAYAEWIQSAADLYGAGSPECLQTRRALQSVEMDQPGYCSGLPARLPQATDVEGW